MRGSNLLLAGLGLAAVAGITYFIIKEVKKSEKEIDEQEKETEKSLEDLGVSTETLKEHNVSIINPKNLPEEMHKTISTSTSWDIDCIDPEKVLEDATILHVTESEFNNKKQLDFIFELPNINEKKEREVGYNVIKTSYKYPKIKDFKLAFDKASDEMSKLVGNNCRPFRKLEAYLVVNVIGEKIHTYIKKIPQEWYESYKKETNDGVAAFYEDYCDKRKSEEIREDLKKRFVESYISEGDENDEYSIEVVEVFLGWRISFQERIGNRSGIDLISGLSCLKYVIEDFSVKRDGNEENAVYYKSMLFHEPTIAKFSDLSSLYYDLDGKIEELEY